MLAVAYSNGIAPVNLSRRHEIRERLDQMALDGPFQVASAISHIGALLQQEFLGFFREVNQEWLACGGVRNTLLQHSQLDVYDPAQFFLAQRLKHHDLIQAVHEFRCELSSGSLDAGACEPDAELRFWTDVFTRGVMKSQPRFNESAHLGRAEVAGHENYRTRKIHAAIIAQRQSGLVQDPQK